MHETDSIVAIIKPTAKCLEWINSHPESVEKFTLDEIRQDCTALLIPSFDTFEEAEEFIAEIHEGIFENELESWHDNHAFWPQVRNYDVFREWFDIEIHSMVYDLSSLEDYEEDEETETSAE